MQCASIALTDLINYSPMDLTGYCGDSIFISHTQMCFI